MRRPKTTRVDKKQSIADAWKVIHDVEWPFEPELQFHELRRWRFDWGNRELMLAVEVEGITNFGGAIGRHQSADGIEGDMEKYNTAAAMGWVVLRFSQRMIQRDPFACCECIVAAAEIIRGRIGNGN